MTASLDSGARFGFGRNWRDYLELLSEERVVEAENSLKAMLDRESLAGVKFLDIGSGSGLFSLAARRLGAEVCSFDYDKDSVDCTKELMRKYFPEDDKWSVCRGSILDRDFVNSLPQFDIVYSWGVLHHTGAMWLAFENAISRVAQSGQLFIAIYNDQGLKSRVWWIIKYVYNVLPRSCAKIFSYSLGVLVNFLNLIRHAFRGKAGAVISNWMNYKSNRGMSFWHDIIDWYGGFPYEYASYEVLREYFLCRGFVLEKGERATSLGCHQIVFRRQSH